MLASCVWWNKITVGYFQACRRCWTQGLLLSSLCCLKSNILAMCKVYLMAVCVCVCVCVIISLCSWVFLCTLMRYIGFMGVLFSYCLTGCFSMMVWTHTVFECLKSYMHAFSIFLYLHLFSAIEHVSHGKAL